MTVLSRLVLLGAAGVAAVTLTACPPIQPAPLPRATPYMQPHPPTPCRTIAGHIVLAFTIPATGTYRSVLGGGPLLGIVVATGSDYQVTTAQLPVHIEWYDTVESHWRQASDVFSSLPTVVCP